MDLMSARLLAAAALIGAVASLLAAVAKILRALRGSQQRREF
jgi:hypothetical protein